MNEDYFVSPAGTYCAEFRLATDGRRKGLVIEALMLTGQPFVAEPYFGMNGAQGHHTLVTETRVFPSVSICNVLILKS